ncbi:DUF6370 family protein [Winogradskyella pulchriflava]|uniref:DUF6370 family protein n=1 Tax=Winogradskyella pulchriflava TaxID=1110688 RepID=A0ABV6Q4L0_9FLAO
MKNLITACFVVLIVACANPKTEKQIAEVSCGQCQFGLTSQKGCDLAVRIDDKAYFVDGANIDDFGDAHDVESGFCEVIRKGEIEGEIVEGRFKVTNIKMLD